MKTFLVIVLTIIMVQATISDSSKKVLDTNIVNITPKCHRGGWRLFPKQVYPGSIPGRGAEYAAVVQQDRTRDS